MKAPLQIAFLTGQSDPSNCALSPVQERFLRALSDERTIPVLRNFPYTGTAPHKAIPLWQASLHNLRQFLQSRKPDFSRRHAAQVTTLLLRSPRTLILAGSCGLELFCNLGLQRDVLKTCSVLAYGPVTRSLPAGVRLRVAQGRRDLLSRAFVQKVDCALNCGHLDYLKSPAFLQYCQAVVRDELHSLA